MLAEDERSELAAALVARTRAPDWSVPPQLEAGRGRELGVLARAGFPRTWRVAHTPLRASAVQAPSSDKDWHGIEER